MLAFGIMAVGTWFIIKTSMFLYVPPEDPGREVVFVVEPGQTFLQIARNLHAENLITDVKRFWGMAEEKGLTAKVKAGEFLLHTNWLPDKVLETITSSPGILHPFTVREGLTWWQVGALMEEAGLATAEEFAAAVRDPELLAKYAIPADTAEGYLFPETYMLTKAGDNSARTLTERMVKECFRVVDEVYPMGRPTPQSLHQTIILASIVEKETGDVSERARIAGVYTNRLRRPMRLQADPTTIYGLGPEFNGNLRFKHLEDRGNPYNTYQHDGLPPGPICSPGKGAIEGAEHPEDHHYLYFVAKGDGTHHFSKTLREHNQAVGRYQKWGRDRKSYTSSPQ